jgi:hypothetical protein
MVAHCDLDAVQVEQLEELRVPGELDTKIRTGCPADRAAFTTPAM